MRKMCLVAVFSIFFISAVLIVGASNLTESGSAVKRIDPILLTPEDPRRLYDFLCMVESDKDYIHSIKIKVKSMDNARIFLSSRGLLGQDKGHSIKLDTNKTFGILLEILEAE